MTSQFDNERPSSSGRLPTQFAPAERALLHEIIAQAEQFQATLPETHAILSALPDVVVVLNRQRQIIFANRSMLTLLERDSEQLLGLRPGEALDCIHASETPGGCGTTAFCSTCGAVRAILMSQRGQADVQECRIIVRGSSDALDLRVWATPYQMDGEHLTVFTLQDIRDEKRRRVLERIFFHDVLNTAGAISAAAEIIVDAGSEPPQEVVELLGVVTDRLVEEIKAQRDLLAAESYEYAVSLGPVNAHHLLRSLAQTYSQHPVAAGRSIKIVPPDEALGFLSDARLLRRVLGNMLKNALEASEPGGVVTLGCRGSGQEIEFWVHNPGVMPRDVQLQVFQRSFSTKGSGRGLGAYSMKLLSERYLQGKVTFDSTPATGTTFRAIYPLLAASHAAGVSALAPWAQRS